MSASMYTIQVLIFIKRIRYIRGIRATLTQRIIRRFIGMRNLFFLNNWLHRSKIFLDVVYYWSLGMVNFIVFLDQTNYLFFDILFGNTYRRSFTKSFFHTLIELPFIGSNIFPVIKTFEKTNPIMLIF